MEDEWKIPEESEQEEDLEDAEDAESLVEEPLENIIQETGTSFVRRTDAEQINPFLEQESIETVSNLEQDLKDVPTTQDQNHEEQVDYETTNAPQYSSSYDANYETAREQGQTDPEMTTSALRRETDMMDIGGLQERRIDLHGWQQSHMGSGQRQTQGRQENYMREPARFKEQGKLPFQRRKKLF